MAFFAFVACHRKGQNMVQGVETPLDSIAQTDVMTLPIEVHAKKITLQDGLPSNTVNSMLQDQKGFLWFGTHNGLVRYDGNKMMVYRHDSVPSSIADSRIKDIIEDKDYKKLWVYTSAELFSCIDMRSGKAENFVEDGERQCRFTNAKLTAPGIVWLWGKSDGALRVDYRNGEFHTQHFDKANLGSSSVLLFDSISSREIMFCSKDRAFVYDDQGLKCVARGVKILRTRPWKGQMLVISSEGRVYTLYHRKLTLMTKIPFAKRERVSGDLMLGDRWIVFTNLGAWTIDKKGYKVTHCEGEWNIPNGKVYTDNKKRRWIYNKTGTLRMVQGEQVVSLNLLPNGESNYIDYERFRVVEDNHGLIWISTYGNGLFVFSHDLKQSQHFTADEKGESPIASNYLLRIIADRYDGVWVSSEYGGVSHIQVMDKGVERIFPNGSGNLDFSNVVRMVRKTTNGVLVSTRDGSLYHYSSDMRQLLGTSHFDANIYAFAEHNGEKWLGTRGKGVYGVEGLSLGDCNVFCMTPDNHNRMWIGTFGKGLKVATRKENGKYDVQTVFADSVGLSEVRCLAKDKKGRLWIGTSGGLIVLNPDRFVRNHKDYQIYHRDYEIHDLSFDRHGVLWLAAPGVGLVRVEGGDHPVFRKYNNENGLVNDMVQSVVEGKDGNYWLPTQQGVSCMDAKTGTFDNYMFDINPMGNVYNENSAVCLDDGRILLGGNYGLTLVTPSKLKHISGQTNVVFTSYPYSDEITLNYDDNSPTIDFSTLDYSDVSNVKYSYWLEGYDTQWSTPSSVSWASFSHLSPKTYRLHAKACYSDGDWGKESVLTIVVRPPFYLSIWAILIYLVVAGLVTGMVVRNVREKNELKNKIMVEQELTKYKLTFFTNIAHEFRTPLTLIQGALEKETKIMKANKWQPELEKTIRTMNKSVQRMLRLINQLLEFRKMQAGKLKLSLQETDAVMFCRNIFQMFDDAAESKNITYKFETSESAYVMYLDRQKLDKVVFNILSNAFKYTPTGGTITMSLALADQLTIRIVDTGVGIPPEKRDQLFNRFMQSNYTGDSFGIGLHLTHELVNVHHGTISYEENPGGGSVFVVNIPTNKDVYDTSDFLVESSPILESSVKMPNLPELTKTAEVDKRIPLNKRTILLIEDDNDVRDFLLSELGNCFETISASDGQEGLAKAKENDVDLIVSDVMMPGMNGFEVTKRLKNSFETSHIPIILLTALGNDESILEGTESGADAYMVKPFSPQLLIARIFQLLDQREKLKQKFGKDLESVRSSMCSTNQDQLFVRRLDTIIYSKLGEKDLSVEKIAELLKLGRTMFYKKVRGTTGYTPNEYIRVIRLRKAAEMLRSGDKNVSEVAYAVGFDNPYYFSKCFKDQFGVPPSQYK